MSATFTTKCPQCNRVTSQFIDSELTKDRTEFDGKRCKKCVRTTHANGKPKKKGDHHGMYQGTGRGLYPNKKTQALKSFRMYGGHY